MIYNVNVYSDQNKIMHYKILFSLIESAHVICACAVNFLRISSIIPI